MTKQEPPVLGDNAVIADKLNDYFNQQSEHLPKSTEQALYNARLKALQARSKKPEKARRSALYAMAATLVLTTSGYLLTQSEPVAPLPLANFSAAQMPAEDLTLLTDIEFVEWLAANEQQLVL